MKPRFHSPFPMLACQDLAASVSFYRDLLGFEETYRFPEEGDPAFVVLTLDGASVGLGATDHPPLHGRAYTPRAGHLFEFCVYTDDVDAATAELLAAGVTVLVEPQEQPWGERVAYVCDPDDNPVMITAPTAPS